MNTEDGDDSCSERQRCYPMDSAQGDLHRASTDLDRCIGNSKIVVSVQILNAGSDRQHAPGQQQSRAVKVDSEDIATLATVATYSRLSSTNYQAEMNFSNRESKPGR